MKGVPIQFRAKDVRTGEYVYGLPNVDGNGVFRFIFDYHTNHQVDENTITQLCGYDADGKEVYGGDILVDGYGTEYKVFMASMFAVSDKYALDLNPAMTALYKLKLKENNNDFTVTSEKK